MSSSNTVRVGIMPGRINEFAVEEGTSIASLLEQASLSPQGYDVKVDGTKVDPASATVTSSTNLVLLVKQVKGNAKTVRVGIMPGRINEFAVEEGDAISELLAQASLDPKGYDVKVDGTKVNPDEATVNASTNLVLLVKQVKGN